MENENISYWNQFVKIELRTSLWWFTIALHYYYHVLWRNLKESSSPQQSFLYIGYLILFILHGHVACFIFAETLFYTSCPPTPITYFIYWKVQLVNRKLNMHKRRSLLSYISSTFSWSCSLLLLISLIILLPYTYYIAIFVSGESLIWLVSSFI